MALWLILFVFLQEDQCLSPEVIFFLEATFGENASDVQAKLLNHSGLCSGNDTNLTGHQFLLPPMRRSDLNVLYAGLNVFGYITPFVIIVGLIGNGISLRIFTERSMRKVSASVYLGALAVSDSAVLVVYVLFDWLQLGLPTWPPHNAVNVLGTNGVCQIYLFLSYSFRFLSAWLIVVFTIERYIGICKPLHRRVICSGSFAKKAICILIVVSFAVSLFKPLLGAVIEIPLLGKVCAYKPQYERLNFALDAIYGATITAVPFLIICALNLLIIRKFSETRKRHKKAKFLSNECVIKLEFTVILLMVSSSFVVLNLPYFVVWCMKFRQQLLHSLNAGNPTAPERLRGWLYITKTVFFLNYCVNFFLYSLTGPHFRRKVRMLLRKMKCFTQNPFILGLGHGLELTAAPDAESRAPATLHNTEATFLPANQKEDTLLSLRE